MVTLHPTAKKFANGFVPMITMRGEKGQMIGSKTPQGGYREFNTFTCPNACADKALHIALRVASQFPGVLRVAM